MRMDSRRLSQRLSCALSRSPTSRCFGRNTAGFVHEIPAGMLADGDGSGAHVRVQVLTNAGALDRDKQLAVVAELTRLVAEAAGDPAIADRTWVLLTEAPDGGWGLHGHAHTNSELVAAARAEIAELSAARGR